MEGRVKSHISNKTYITDLEKLEEEDVDATSELYMIPISGHTIRIAPGKTMMDEDTGIAYCYVYVIQNDKVTCKLGVYEKKTDKMPLFFDLSTFPEGSFCLFEEYETNTSKLLELEMETTGTTTKANVTNVFDFLIDEFAKMPNKKERLKSAYKSLFSTYETKKTLEKYKQMKPILKMISNAGKEEPTDAFIRTLKTNAADKPVFVMTLLALERVFLIDFTFVTEYEMVDERDEYIKMKEDWSVSNATKDVEVDVNTYAILEPNYIPKNAKASVDEESEEEPEPEPEPEPELEPEPEPEPEVEPVPEPIVQPLTVKSKTKPKPATISETEPFSMSESEIVKVKKNKNKTPKSESVPKASVPKESSKSVSKASVPKEPSVPKESPKSVLKASVPKESSKSVLKASVPKEPSVPKASVPEEQKASLSETLSKKKEKANKPESAAKTEPVTLKQSRSIPVVKLKTTSQPDKVV